MGMQLSASDSIRGMLNRLKGDPKLSFRSISKTVDIPLSTISKFTNGSKVLAVDQADRLCRYLRVPARKHKQFLREVRIHRKGVSLNEEKNVYDQIVLGTELQFLDRYLSVFFTIYDFEYDLEKLSKILGVSESAIGDSIERQVNAGTLSISDCGRVFRIPISYTTQKDCNSLGSKEDFKTQLKISANLRKNLFAQKYEEEPYPMYSETKFIVTNKERLSKCKEISYYLFGQLGKLAAASHGEEDRVVGSLYFNVVPLTDEINYENL